MLFAEKPGKFSAFAFLSLLKKFPKYRVKRSKKYQRYHKRYIFLKVPTVPIPVLKTYRVTVPRYFCTAVLPNSAEHFNDYFVKIGHSIAESVSNQNSSDFRLYLKNSGSETIILNSPEPIEIYNAVNSLNIHKASGFDNISPFFLRIRNKILAPILPVFFTMYLRWDIFPKFLQPPKLSLFLSPEIKNKSTIVRAWKL